jgi:hypothetical protein
LREHTRQISFAFFTVSGCTVCSWALHMVLWSSSFHTLGANWCGGWSAHSIDVPWTVNFLTLIHAIYIYMDISSSFRNSSYKSHLQFGSVQRTILGWVWFNLTGKLPRWMKPEH